MARYGLREVANVTFIDLSTGKPAFYLDTLKMSDVTLASKNVQATGGQGGAPLMSWDYGRTITLDVQDAYMNPTAVAALSGSALSTGAQTVHMREVLTLDSSKKIVLQKNSVTIIGIYKTTDGYDQGQEQIVTTDYTLTAGTAPAGDSITFTTGAQGDKMIVYYTFTSAGATSDTLITLSADAFPGYYKIVGDTLQRNDSTGLDEKMQFVVAKAKLAPDFKISLQADATTPSVFDFKLEAYKDPSLTWMMQMMKWS